MDRDLLKLIEDRLGDLSKGQRLIGRYITEHYDKAAFMTAAKLGAKVGVSESTVVRFATEIGFEGYPQLQRALQEMIRSRLTTVQRMEATNDQVAGGDILGKVLSLDIEKIRRTIEETSREDFGSAVDAIVAADHIYIMGIRSASAIASFLGFYFNHIFSNAKLVNTSSTSEVFEQIHRIGKNDVLISLSFPRYSQITVSAAHFAKGTGAKVIAITDSKDSPLSQHSDYLLLARSEMVSFIDSLVAPLSLVNALIVAVGLKKIDQVGDTYRKLENIWDAYNVYEKSGRS